eukprot:6069192-Amphidinium_carterae.1
MANVDQFAQQLNALQQELQQQHQRLQQVEAANVPLRADGLGALRNLLQLIQALQWSADTRQTTFAGGRKPATCSGKGDEWREGSVKLESFVVGACGEDTRA